MECIIKCFQVRFQLFYCPRIMSVHFCVVKDEGTDSQKRVSGRKGKSNDREWQGNNCCCWEKMKKKPGFLKGRKINCMEWQGKNCYCWGKWKNITWIFRGKEYVIREKKKGKLRSHFWLYEDDKEKQEKIIWKERKKKKKRRCPQKQRKTKKKQNKTK